jgi:hypothetical protein
MMRLRCFNFGDIEKRAEQNQAGTGQFPDFVPTGGGTAREVPVKKSCVRLMLFPARFRAAGQTK